MQQADPDHANDGGEGQQHAEGHGDGLLPEEGDAGGLRVLDGDQGDRHHPAGNEHDGGEIGEGFHGVFQCRCSECGNQLGFNGYFRG